jgi:hypothetical protein
MARTLSATIILKTLSGTIQIRKVLSTNNLFAAITFKKLSGTIQIGAISNVPNTIKSAMPVITFTQIFSVLSVAGGSSSSSSSSVSSSSSSSSMSLSITP